MIEVTIKPWCGEWGGDNYLAVIENDGKKPILMWFDKYEFTNGILLIYRNYAIIAGIDYNNLVASPDYIIKAVCE